MTAHQLARHLLTLPDLPVIINGWGSSEGLGPFEVNEAYADEEPIPYDENGKPQSGGRRIPVIELNHGDLAVWRTR